MGIVLDRASFDPWRIRPVTHTLSDHELLAMPALRALGQRQNERGLVRTHSADAAAGTSFADAPNLCPNDKSTDETLADVAAADAWTSLLNVQADPIYRAFIDEVLDDVRPVVDEKDPGMCYRAGWIFISSPGAVTPFHMDHEHNFILQIHGKKRVFVWPHDDQDVISERAQEMFHDAHSREGVVWRERFRDKAQVFELSPGQGAYMPSTSPHMVENGDAPSVTMSFTYYTDATRRRELLYRGNARLRRLGLSPRPVGTSWLADTTKHAALTTYTGLSRRIKRALGTVVVGNDAPYAPA